jgi:hypothetical protein
MLENFASKSYVVLDFHLQVIHPWSQTDRSIPEVSHWPEWASWDYNAKWLPEEVHQHDGFNEWRAFVREQKPYEGREGGLPSYKQWERLCLMFGLLL